jgi:putative sigma-54 modulation protein
MIQGVLFLETREMNITITGNNIEVTPAMRKYAMEKLKRIKKVCGEALHLICSFSFDAAAKEKQHKHRISITLRTGGTGPSVGSDVVATKKKGVEIFIEQLHANMYAALDRVVDRLIRQVSRRKGKTVKRERLMKVSSKTRHAEMFSGQAPMPA